MTPGGLLAFMLSSVSALPYMAYEAAKRLEETVSAR